MGFFLSSKVDTEYAALIDIGSASVLVAIIASNPDKDHPDIIWSKREFAPLKKIDALSDSIKGIISTLLNSCLALDGEGSRALYEYAKINRPSKLQITVAAPWAYTSTKTINFENTESFEVTDDLVEELLRTANQKSTEEMLEAEKLHDHGLEMVGRTTLQVLANGYQISVNGKQEASSVQVVESASIIEERLLLALTDTQKKIFPKISYRISSFMLPFYFVIKNTINEATEFCLVDVTGEATELGIVRDGILTHVSHIPYGSFSIAREISEILNVPLEEAYGYLACDDLTCFTAQTSDKQKTDIDAVLSAYQDRLSKLFLETGDVLAIPKWIYLHGNLQTELFFSHHLSEAATLATKTKHAIYNVTHELLKKNFTEDEAKSLKNSGQDTGLLISAQFFHTNRTDDSFKTL